ncbi:hypothetical protein D3C80_1801080 [compost metagenome]
MIFLLINVPVTLNLDNNLLGKSVHYGHTHTVQTARYFVPSTAELTSGMQDRHYNFQG